MEGIEGLQILVHSHQQVHILEGSPKKNSEKQHDLAVMEILPKILYIQAIVDEVIEDISWPG
jgi:hypothetical protein